MIIIIIPFDCTVIRKSSLVIVLSVRMQVAIWRDIERRRLVIAFRGTEQVGSKISIIRKIYVDFPA